MASTNNFYLKFWRWVVLGAPAWWFLGVNLGIYHLAALLLLIGMMQSSLAGNLPVFLSSSSKFLFAYVVIYAFSLTANAPTAGDSMRVIASAYNLSYWIMGLFLVTVMSNVFSLADTKVVFKTFFDMSLVIGLLTVVILILMLAGFQTLMVYTPFYDLTKLLGHTTLVENSLVVKMLYWEWFASTLFPRFNLFSPYAVATAEVLVFILVMSICHAQLQKKLRSPLFLFISLCVFFAMLMTLSRMPVIAFIAGGLVVFLIGKRQSFIWILLFSIFLFSIYPWIDQSINFILNLRQGSNLGRLELYRYSLSRLEGIEWIIGRGIKNREELNFVGPLGSHSTYLSVLFRTGLVGLATFVSFQIYLFWTWYGLKSAAAKSPEHFFLWRALGWIFIAISMCMVTDEIDVPQLVAFLYFSLVGIFEGFRRSIEVSPGS